MSTRMAQKRDTAENWSSNNPILLAGEIGIESDENKMKLGDGESHWEDLPYFGGGSGSQTPWEGDIDADDNYLLNFAGFKRQVESEHVNSNVILTMRDSEDAMPNGDYIYVSGTRYQHESGYYIEWDGMDEIWKFYDDMGSVINSESGGTLLGSELLPTNQEGTYQNNSVSLAEYCSIEGNYTTITIFDEVAVKCASDNVRNSHAEEITTYSTEYVKLKTITFLRALHGVVRCNVDMRSNGYQPVYARVYKNGEAVGEEMSQSNYEYEVKTTDFAISLEPGDTLELWGYSSSDMDYGGYQNFNICYDNQVAVSSANS